MTAANETCGATAAIWSACGDAAGLPPGYMAEAARMFGGGDVNVFLLEQDPRLLLEVMPVARAGGGHGCRDLPGVGLVEVDNAIVLWDRINVGEIRARRLGVDDDREAYPHGLAYLGSCFLLPGWRSRPAPTKLLAGALVIEALGLAEAEIEGTLPRAMPAGLGPRPGFCQRWMLLRDGRQLTVAGVTFTMERLKNRRWQCHAQHHPDELVTEPLITPRQAAFAAWDLVRERLEGVDHAP